VSVLEITDASFEREVLAAQQPVVVDFWAPWCGPCKAIAPILEELSLEHAGRVSFAKVNVDENLETAARYQVMSLPTVIVFDAGEPRETLIGARPRAHFERALAAFTT
jgi:thioredoxin 1